MEEINFFNEEINFDLQDSQKIRNWVIQAAKSENYRVGTINYIFCSDDYLLNVNQDFLKHDYYTDIITFDNSDQEGIISSDIFISIDRVKDNAAKDSIIFLNELHRVMIHGILHLVGYQDKTDDDKRIMRSKEDSYLTLLS